MKKSFALLLIIAIISVLMVGCKEGKKANASGDSSSTTSFTESDVLDLWGDTQINIETQSGVQNSQNGGGESNTGNGGGNTNSTSSTNTSTGNNGGTGNGGSSSSQSGGGSSSKDQSSSKETFSVSSFGQEQDKHYSPWLPF